MTEWSEMFLSNMRIFLKYCNICSLGVGNEENFPVSINWSWKHVGPSWRIFEGRDTISISFTIIDFFCAIFYLGQFSHVYFVELFAEE